MNPRTTRTAPWGAVLAATASALFAWPTPLEAQEATDSLRREVARLAALVDSLSREVARLRAAGQEEEAEDALARLRAAAAEAAGDQPAETTPEQFVGRQRSLQALNPEISVNADVFGHVDQDDPDTQNFFAREFEISFISSLDPFSRAKVFAAYHGGGAEIAPFEEGGHGHGEGEEEGGHADGGFAVEEGYVEWVGLPAGLGLKLGRFFQQFGQLNRWHAHALPFQSRSLPHLAFIGEEALTQSGASVHWLLPLHGAGGTYEATVEVTRRENERLFGESGGVSLLGHLNAFWELTPSTDLDLGVSWLRGGYEDELHAGDRDLMGVETALTWRPPARARYRGFTLRGGVMSLDGLLPHEEEGEEEEHEEGELEPLEDGRAWGAWGAGEVRLSTSWLAGARFDWTQNPAEPDETAWLIAPTLTWWQSEFVRLRLEYDLLGRSFLDENEGRLFLQVSFAMGPHKHETY